MCVGKILCFCRGDYVKCLTELEAPSPPLFPFTYSALRTLGKPVLYFILPKKEIGGFLSVKSDQTKGILKIARFLPDYFRMKYPGLLTHTNLLLF